MPHLPSRVLSLPLLLAGCSRSSEPAIVHIVARDYAYEAPATIRPGPTAFSFTNHGTVLHEIQLFRLRPEIPVDSAIYYLSSMAATDSLAPDAAGSVLWAPPGVSAHEQILVNAPPGATYAIFCQFQDGEGQPMHTKLGMMALIAVE